MAEVPFFVDYLWEKFLENLASRISADNRAKGKTALSAEVLMADAAAVGDRATATLFVKWCAEYLARVPATELFYGPASLGFRLSNGDTVILSPAVDEQSEKPVSVAVTDSGRADRQRTSDVQAVPIFSKGKP